MAGQKYMHVLNVAMRTLSTSCASCGKPKRKGKLAQIATFTGTTRLTISLRETRVSKESTITVRTYSHGEPDEACLVV